MTILSQQQHSIQYKTYIQTQNEVSTENSYVPSGLLILITVHTQHYIPVQLRSTSSERSHGHLLRIVCQNSSTTFDPFMYTFACLGKNTYRLKNTVALSTIRSNGATNGRAMPAAFEPLVVAESACPRAACLAVVVFNPLTCSISSSGSDTRCTKVFHSWYTFNSTVIRRIPICKTQSCLSSSL